MKKFISNNLGCGGGGVGKLGIRLTTLLFWQWGMAIHIIIIVLSVSTTRPQTVDMWSDWQL